MQPQIAIFLVAAVLAPFSALADERTTILNPIAGLANVHDSEYIAGTPRSQPIRHTVGSSPEEYIRRAHKIRKTSPYFSEDESNGIDSNGGIGVGDPTGVGAALRSSGDDTSGTLSDVDNSGTSYEPMVSGQGSTTGQLLTTVSSDPEIQSRIRGSLSDSTLDGEASSYRASSPSSGLRAEIHLFPDARHPEIEPYPESDAEFTNIPSLVAEEDDLDADVISLPPKISLHSPTAKVSDDLDAYLHRSSSISSLLSDGSSDDLPTVSWTEFKTLPAKKNRWDYSSRGPEVLSRVQGFQFCKHLDGAYFDSEAPLRSDMISKIFKATSMIPLDYSKASMKRLQWTQQYFDPGK